MKRRDLIAGAVAYSVIRPVVPARAQTTVTRAAVVIGIDKCVTLPTLSGASSGAREMGDWLTGEGFTVKYFLDDGGQTRIRIGDISDAVREIVNKDTVQQFVVYFSGHGYAGGQDEVWLLTDAPEDPNALIGINGTIRSARTTGIKHIVVISDACRSPAQSIQELGVTPGSIFPNRASQNPETKVDRFLATSIGQPANEVQFDTSKVYRGIFTAAFLNAFSNPKEGMVRELPGGIKVIPDRKLESYLTTEVPKLALQTDPRLSKQRPECDVPSSDDAYIGRLASGARISNAGAPPPEPTQNDVNTAEFSKFGISVTSTDDLQSAAIRRVLAATGFSKTQNIVEESLSVTKVWQQRPNAQSGIVVDGKRVVDVAVHPSHHATISEGSPSVIDVKFGGGSSACSIAIKFDDGAGAIVAAFSNYVATVSASSSGVSNVSYDANFMVGSEDTRLNKLRATAAAAFQFGPLRFKGTQKERQAQAERFGDEVRQSKAIDPSLGIYAAYAFDEAGQRDKLLSVRHYMFGDLKVRIFDLELLAAPVDDANQGAEIVPFCPVLTLGWSLLSATEIVLPEAIRKARSYLLSSPWTTFSTPGMDIIFEALRSGEVR